MSETAPADETTGTDHVEETVEALVQAMVVWDDANYTHCLRTADYAEAIARDLGLDAAAVRWVRLGSLLHDIGKIGVELAVLRKPDKLDAGERESVALHPEMGASILERVLPPAIVDCAAAHHEQPDGNGYPSGLKEADIPLAALICRVADVFDSLTTDQTYRPAMSLPEAISELRAGAGVLYSSRVVNSALRLIEQDQLRAAA